MSDAARLALAALLLVAAGASAAQSGIGDPTRPTALAEPAEGEAAVRGPRWRLQSTLVADQRRVAVINGRAVAQGERVDGARLVEVRPDGVTLEHDGQRISIRLPGVIDIKRSDG